MRVMDSNDEELRRRCQRDCHSRCCRYITIILRAPRRKADFDELSWWLAHKNIIVYVESRRWHLEVRNPCKYLNGDSLCGIYPDRPEVCREYKIKSCEYPERPPHTLHFDTKEAFDTWLARRKLLQKERRRQRTARSQQANSGIYRAGD